MKGHRDDAYMSLWRISPGSTTALARAEVLAQRPATSPSNCAATRQAARAARARGHAEASSAGAGLAGARYSRSATNGAGRREPQGTADADPRPPRPPRSRPRSAELAPRCRKSSPIACAHGQAGPHPSPRDPRSSAHDRSRSNAFGESWARWRWQAMQSQRAFAASLAPAATTPLVRRACPAAQALGTQLAARRPGGDRQGPPPVHRRAVANASDCADRPASRAGRERTCAATDAMIRCREIDHLVLRVADLAAMLAFYRDVLGCCRRAAPGRIGLVQLRAGRSLIDLVPIDGTLGTRRRRGARHGRPQPRPLLPARRAVRRGRDPRRPRRARHRGRTGGVALRRRRRRAVDLPRRSGRQYVELKGPPDRRKRAGALKLCERPRRRQSTSTPCAGTSRPCSTSSRRRASSRSATRRSSSSKLSGFTVPSKANEAAFDRRSSRSRRRRGLLIGSLVTHAAPRDRAFETERAKARSAARFGNAARAARAGRSHALTVAAPEARLHGRRAHPRRTRHVGVGARRVAAGRRIAPAALRLRSRPQSYSAPLP